ncbi:MAG: hypothetical protein U9N59_10075 [Campylobacterota bacterium]|nr:hypothetical protein [Campylobacterota bacterium]
MKNISFNIKTVLASIVTATLLFQGCGSDGIDDVYKINEDSAVSDYTVRVVDDAVKGATVVANECSGFQEGTDGYYTLTGCSSRPKAIISTGGYIELEDQNVTMEFPLMVNTNMVEKSTQYTVTPLTTMLATVDNYNELIELQNSLGFANVQEMFQYDSEDNASVELQRTINSIFIEAKEGGVDLNSFNDFTADFREMIKNADSSGTALKTIKNAKTDLKTDFDNNPGKYLQKYGVVFSGFVTSTDYNSEKGGADLLRDISKNFAGDTNEIVFSGFIYDDIIGTGNSNLYNSDANITLRNLTTDTLVQIEDTKTSVQASAYGQYKLKIKSNDINESVSYLIEGTITNRVGKVIKLNSILTGKEILSKFQTKLNTSDLSDITISNVTTAKYALLKQKGISETDVDAIIAGKQNIENKESELLLDVATGLKTIIDGDANTTGDTFDYIKTRITDSGTTFTAAEDMQTQIADFKAKIQADKTLNSQLNATVYTKFKITTGLIDNKQITFKRNGSKYTSSISLFTDKTYTLNEKNNNAETTHEIGIWSIDTNGDLVLNNAENNILTKLVFNSLTLGQAVYNQYGQFTGINQNPKGKVIKEGASTLFEVSAINDIDLTAISAPMVKFTVDNLKNRTFYKVFLDDNNISTGAIVKFDATASNIYYSENDDNFTSPGSADEPVSIDTHGVLTMKGSTYKIIKEYNKKIVCKETIGGIDKTVEFYSSLLKAAAAKEIQAYSNSTRFHSMFGTYNWGNDDSSNNNGVHNTRITDPFTTLRAIPLNNDKTNYKYSEIGTYLYSSKVRDIVTGGEEDSGNKNIVGLKTQLRVTENNGDSNRQTAGINAKYFLPTCADNTKLAQFYVTVFANYNKVRYKLSIKDTNGVKHNIFTKSVTIVEENTLNVNYEIMILLINNIVVIEVKNGGESYYQYIELDKVWASAPDLLKEYKYPISYRSSYLWAGLYDDGTTTNGLFYGRSNSPITVKMNSFNLISGDIDHDTDDNSIDDSSFAGGGTCTVSSIVSTPTTSISTPTIDWSMNTNYSEIKFWSNTPTESWDNVTGLTIASLPTTNYELEFRQETFSDGYYTTVIPDIDLGKSIISSSDIYWYDYNLSSENFDLYDTETITFPTSTTALINDTVSVKYLGEVDATLFNDASNSVFKSGDKAYKIHVKFTKDTVETWRDKYTDSNGSNYDSFVNFIDSHSSVENLIYISNGYSLYFIPDTTTAQVLDPSRKPVTTATYQVTTMDGYEVMTYTLADTTLPIDHDIVFATGDSGYIESADMIKAGVEFEGFWFNESAKDSFLSYTTLKAQSITQETAVSP